MPKIAEDSTPQQVFDYVINHLKKQVVQAIRPDTKGCRYRAPCGNTCAVGCLLSDDEYDVEMEGQRVRNLIQGAELRSAFWNRHQLLLEDLQRLHDAFSRFEGEAFEQYVSSLAQARGLIYAT